MAEQEFVPPLPPPPVAIWLPDPEETVKYTIQDNWEWVMKDLAHERMDQLKPPAELPSAILRRAQAHEPTPAGLTPGARRRRQKSRRDRELLPSLLKLEVVKNGSDEIAFCVHGTSAALDGLEDKDELVRTLQRCQCKHLNLCPPSTLINWDVRHEECLNIVGSDLPAIESNKSVKVVAVLKEPMGSQGKGIFFVSNPEDIYKVIEEHQRAINLDNLIAAKGRIPSWVLQAEVTPSKLIRGGRKFHIRSYLVVLEKLHDPDLVDVFIFNRHEVRVAGLPVSHHDGTERDLREHITNGALSESSERVLLNEVEELNGLQSRLEVFIAEAFGKHLVSDMGRRIYSGKSADDSSSLDIRKFAIGGLDLMMTESGRIYLLEVNVNPAAPKETTVNNTFKEHLRGFFKEFVDLTTGGSPANFHNAVDILQQNALSEGQ